MSFAEFMTIPCTIGVVSSRDKFGKENYSYSPYMCRFEGTVNLRRYGNVKLEGVQGVVYLDGSGGPITVKTDDAIFVGGVQYEVIRVMPMRDKDMLRHYELLVGKGTG